MKSIVVMTYYQLMHSIALALTFDEKPNLYFSMEFLNPDEELLERIADTGVFNEVRGITRRGEFLPVVRELRKTADMEDWEIDQIGNTIFDEFLENHYAPEFDNADFDDEIYIYNDFQWHFYYMTKHFNNIVGVEDGYGSLRQQISIHMHKGDKERLYPFIEKGYFPEPLYRDKHIKRIISSCDFDDLDDYYRSKLVIWDFKDIVELNPEKFRKALLYIFDIEGLGIKDKSTLYVGQPLDRSRYCNAMHNYMLCKNIIRNELKNGYTVYYKPHPADRNDTRMYGEENVIVLPKSFPVEVFNYQDKKFDRLVTFGSTASSIATCANESYRYFDKTEFEREDVTDAIKEQIAKEKVTMLTVVKVRELTPETFINVYSCIYRNSYIKTCIHVAISDELDLEECRRYLDSRNMSAMIREYKKETSESKEALLWHKELGWIKKWLSRYNPKISFHSIGSLDDWDIYHEIVKSSGHYDYMMILDSGNPAFQLTNEIIAAIRIRTYPAIFFRMYSAVKNDRNQTLKILLNQGYLGEAYNGDISNKLIHREVMRAYDAGKQTPQSFAVLMKDYDEYVRKTVGLSLHVDAEKYLKIEDGYAYYKKRADDAIAAADEKTKEDYLGELANIVYEYYDWYSVVNHNALGVSVSELAEELIEDDSLKLEIYKRFADAMTRERALTNNLGLMQEGNYYLRIKPIVDIAARHGVLRGVENAGRVKDKLIPEAISTKLKEKKKKK